MMNAQPRPIAPTMSAQQATPYAAYAVSRDDVCQRSTEGKNCIGVSLTASANLSLFCDLIIYLFAGALTGAFSVLSIVYGLLAYLFYIAFIGSLWALIKPSSCIVVSLQWAKYVFISSFLVLLVWSVQLSMSYGFHISCLLLTALLICAVALFYFQSTLYSKYSKLLKVETVKVSSPSVSVV